MRIGLYGMPTAGKSYIMERIDFLDVYAGSTLLRTQDPAFDFRDEKGKEKVRREVAAQYRKKDRFIMDGHYAFGDRITFTDEEGEMYDRYLYLYIDPDILRKRMEASTKNRKYLCYDPARWQVEEIEGLRAYCHQHDKDFYVLDCSPENAYVDVCDALPFLREIVDGYSNVACARRIAERILATTSSEVVTLLDGDRTFIREDSSRLVFDYRTQLFDNNFYTGYQSWRQYREFESYAIRIPAVVEVHRNEKLPTKLEGDAFIISSGHKLIWERIAEQFGMTAFAGNEVSAETKYFVAKLLRRRGKTVVAYGDSMSDYFMLKEADRGYLMTKAGGTLSRSLAGRNLGGIQLV